jgi:hypothetical protein
MAATSGQGADPQSWTGRTVHGSDGKLGKLEHVYVSEETQQPTWGVVKTGPFGRKRQFVPLQDARDEDGAVHVPVRSGHVKGAPTVPADNRLDPETEDRLGRHYARSGELTDRRERQHEEYGGFNIGAAFFGWLVAIAMTAIIAAIVAAVAGAIGLSSLSPQEARTTAGTISIVAAAVLLLILFLAYLCGGYVAGRMSRFDGARQGLGVWLIGLIITILLAAAGAILGAEFNVFAQLGVQPRIPVGEGALTVGGIIALVAWIVATLGGAVVGGKVGERYHRKVDRAGF